MATKRPKTGKEFVELARESDKVNNVREGKGSHVVVEFRDGTSVTIPVHDKKQLGKGILHKITRVFKATGLLGIILMILWIGSRFFPLLH